MTHYGSKWRVRLKGEKHSVEFNTFAEAERYEFEKLWAPLLRARSAGRALVLPADVVRQVKQFFTKEKVND